MRLDAAVGTSGIGFLIVTPALSNDVPCCFHTGSSFAGTTLAPLSANDTLTVGVSTIVMGNLPYSYSSFSVASGGEPNVTGRMISCGVRGYYTGRTTNQAGLMYCHVSPTHANVCRINGGAVSTGVLSALSTTEVSNNDRDLCMLSTHPIDANELEYQANYHAGTGNLLYPFAESGYQNGGFYYSTIVGTVGSAVMAILFSGVPGETVHFEIVSHIEYVGSYTAASVSPTSVDDVGAKMVMTAALRMPALKNSHPKTTTTWSLLMSSIRSVWKEAKPIVIPATTAALQNLLAAAL